MCLVVLYYILKLHPLEFTSIFDICYYIYHIRYLLVCNQIILCVTCLKKTTISCGICLYIIKNIQQAMVDITCDFIGHSQNQ